MSFRSNSNVAFIEEGAIVKLSVPKESTPIRKEQTQNKISEKPDFKDYRLRLFSESDMTYDMMEDELTCPVCLELFADPLMLPCSHSICKKCLQDIITSRVKSGKEGLECPSCRKMHTMTKNKMATLPKNLALENIVCRFQEIQSNTMTKSKSLDLSTSSYHSLEMPDQIDSDIPVFSEESSSSNENCGLCEANTLSKAEWFCQKCSVLYCQKCLEIYHPKKGQLQHHKLCRPSNRVAEVKPVFCRDHNTETVTIFCDTCKVLVCHLCVCEEVGKHSGHKILPLDVAWKTIKDSVIKSKVKLEVMMSTISDQNSQMEDLTTDVEKIHKEATEKIEQQYRRLVHDLTSALDQQKQSLINKIMKQKSNTTSLYRGHTEGNKKLLKSFENLAETSKKLLDEEFDLEILQKSSEIEQLLTQVDKLSKEMNKRETNFTSFNDSKPRLEDLKLIVRKCRENSLSFVQSLTGDEGEQCTSILPTILSVAVSPGKPDQPRVQSKYLITWGFNSNTYTAETVPSNSLWSVTVEKNSNQMGNINSGYLFGVGISSQVLKNKDQVGMNPISYGVVCSNGNLCMCHNGKMEPLMEMNSLPISFTINVTKDEFENLLLAYKILTSDWGEVLCGKKLIVDSKFKQTLHPVFTVSHRVKVQLTSGT